MSMYEKLFHIELVKQFVDAGLVRISELLKYGLVERTDYGFSLSEYGKSLLKLQSTPVEEAAYVDFRTGVDS